MNFQVGQEVFVAAGAPIAEDVGRRGIIVAEGDYGDDRKYLVNFPSNRKGVSDVIGVYKANGTGTWFNITVSLPKKWYAIFYESPRPEVQLWPRSFNTEKELVDRFLELNKSGAILVHRFQA